ncbi:hypothetical protein VP01_2152g11 [Puccinia sorghi]|uniref:Retrotransposon Copia-like N-terminal domain-containing protein n=1 Tax=Puccinia sorghi TaxID=27349 RepID=A0A0L6VAA0_9BASI|nr:hypothetical protein VP01_2152g11 [Puccinia sorghi]
MSTNEVVVARNSKVMLNNKNYTLWLIPMEAKLYKIKALTIVTGAIACPDPEKDKENSCLYVKINKEAYAEIVQHLSPEVLAYVSSLLPTADKFDGFWQLLKAKFTGNDLTSKTTALKKFLTVEYESFATFLPQI